MYFASALKQHVLTLLVVGSSCQVAPEAHPVVVAVPTARAAPIATPDAGVGAEATLIVERVSSVSECGTSDLGVDLVLEVHDATGRHLESVFCSPWSTTTGTVRRRNLWQMCREFHACSTPPATSSTDRIEVTCGHETIMLRTDDHHTWITGPFGEHQIAPVRFRSVNVRRRTRRAMVDC